MNDLIPWCDILVNDPGVNTHQQRESTIALNGGDISVVYGDKGEDDGDQFLNIGFARSTDGGASFIDRGPIPHGSGGTKPPGYEGDNADPISAWDRNRNYLYLVVNPYPAPDNRGRFNFLRSSDNGQTFTDLMTKFPDEFDLAEDSVDKPWIVVDEVGTPSDPGNGNIYCVFTNHSDDSNTRESYFYKSSNFGQSWMPYVNNPMVVRSDVTIAIPFVVVGPSHEIYVFVFMGDSSSLVIEGYKSTDFGNSFNSIASVNLVKPGFESLGLPAVFEIFEEQGSSDYVRQIVQPQAVVDAAGNVHLVYTDAGGEKTVGRQQVYDEADIFLRTYDPQADSWSAPLTINDDSSANDQWNPVSTMKPDRSQLFIEFNNRS